MALQTIDPITRLLNRQQKQIFSPDTTASAVSQAQDSLNKRNELLGAISRATTREQEPQLEMQGGQYSGDVYQDSGMSVDVPTGEQGSIMPTSAPVTQKFGNVNPGIETFSGGVNLGTDFAIKEGTPVGLPPGEWIVETTYQGAKPGNRSANYGSGNMVRVRNAQTGETLAFEHLKGVSVQAGQKLKGGTVIGTSGNTGNSTGPHLSIPYKNSQGKYQDVLSSPYSKYLFGQGGGGADLMLSIQEKLNKARQLIRK